MDTNTNTKNTIGAVSSFSHREEEQGKNAKERAAKEIGGQGLNACACIAFFFFFFF